MIHPKLTQALDYYRTTYPHLNHHQYLVLYANEGFLRRASMIGSEFMLKGSFLSREYFPSAQYRVPQDLDFVSLSHETNSEFIESTLSKWLNAVTQFPLDDGLVFQPFSVHTSWGIADYQNDITDFETFYNQIRVKLNEQELTLGIDISIHLKLLEPPEPLILKTAIDELYMPYTAPICTQIAWKLSQSIILPRLKDIYDLSYLVSHINHEKMRHQVMQIMLDDIRPIKYCYERIAPFFDYHLKDLFSTAPNLNNINTLYKFYLSQYQNELIHYCPYSENHLDEFNKHFKNAMHNAGFTREWINQHYGFLNKRNEREQYFKNSFKTV